MAGPANGTLTLNADGSFNYVPAFRFYGTDSFTYQSSDGGFVTARQAGRGRRGPVDVIPMPTDRAHAFTLVDVDDRVVKQFEHLSGVATLGQELLA